MFSVFLGKLSQLPRAAADTQKPTLLPGSDVWQRYDDAVYSSHQTPEEPSHSMLLLSQLTSLSEVANDMVNDFYAPREGRFTTRRLAAAYARYQEWHEQLPDVFRPQNTSLPHVLVLHMYYVSLKGARVLAICLHVVIV